MEAESRSPPPCHQPENTNDTFPSIDDSLIGAVDMDFNSNSEEKSLPHRLNEWSRDTFPEMDDDLLRTVETQMDDSLQDPKDDRKISGEGRTKLEQLGSLQEKLPQLESQVEKEVTSWGTFPSLNGVLGHPETNSQHHGRNSFPMEGADDTFSSLGDSLIAAAVEDNAAIPCKKRRISSHNNGDVSVGVAGAGASNHLDKNLSSLSVTQEVKPSTSKGCALVDHKSSRLEAGSAQSSGVVLDSWDTEDDGEDAFLFDIAHVTEDSEELRRQLEDDEWVEEDGVVDENRFRTGLGRPHPLLVPEVSGGS